MDLVKCPLATRRHAFAILQILQRNIKNTLMDDICNKIRLSKVQIMASTRFGAPQAGPEITIYHKWRPKKILSMYLYQQGTSVFLAMLGQCLHFRQRLI